MNEEMCEPVLSIIEQGFASFWANPISFSRVMPRCMLERLTKASKQMEFVSSGEISRSEEISDTIGEKMLSGGLSIM